MILLIQCLLIILIGSVAYNSHKLAEIYVFQILDLQYDLDDCYNST